MWDGDTSVATPAYCNIADSAEPSELMEVALLVRASVFPVLDNSARASLPKATGTSRSSLYLPLSGLKLRLSHSITQLTM